MGGGRRLATRIALGAFGVLCLALAVWVLLGGGKSEDTSKLEAVLLFVPFGLAMLAGAAIMGAPKATATRPPEVRTEVRGGVAAETRVYTFSLRKLRISFAACLAFALMGVGIVLSGGVVLGAIVVLIFTVALAAGAMNLRGGGPVLALTHDGIAHRAGAEATFVAWDDVREVFWMEVRGTPFLCLDAGGEVRLDVPALMRGLARLNRGFSGGDLSIAVDTLEQDAEELEARIHALIDASPGERRRLLTADAAAFSSPL